MTLDVTSPSSIAEAVKTVQSTNDGRLKYLVNNSGVGMMMPLLDVDIQEAKKVFEVNLWGVLAVTKAFAPLVVKDRGTVVVVGSSRGIVNLPWAGMGFNPARFRKRPSNEGITISDDGQYATSKAAVNLLSETLRLELEPLGVKVITVVAGMVKSNFFAAVDEKYKIPTTSFYKSMEGPSGRMAKREDLPGSAMSPEDFRNGVARDVLAGQTR